MPSESSRSAPPESPVAPTPAGGAADLDASARAEFAAWLLSGGLLVLEDEAPYIPELVLQVIWNEGRLRSPLHTTEGRRVHVLHPGIWNVGGGPDFRGAALLLDGVALRGDVEIHLEPEGWRQHGHDRQSSYDTVALHVVWQNPRRHDRYPAHLPLCVVADQLSEPLDQILASVDVYHYPYARKVGPSRAAAHLATLSDAEAARQFRAWGLARLMGKAAALRQAWDTSGPDQAVYAAILEALGYHANRAAGRELARRLPLAALVGQDRDGMQALLLGAAGLLPDPSRDAVHPAYRPWLDRLWDRWWSARPAAAHPPIPWTRGGLRPGNSPERRLLAAADILHRLGPRPAQALLQAAAAAAGPRAILRAWRDLLEVDLPALAAFHTFAGPMRGPARLLGESRIRDILATLCAPLLMADAMRRGHLAHCRAARAVMEALPRLQDNRRFQEAAHLLFVPPSRQRDIIHDACGQLGLLQVHDDFLAAGDPRPGGDSPAPAP